MGLALTGVGASVYEGENLLGVDAGNIAGQRGWMSYH